MAAQQVRLWEPEPLPARVEVAPGAVWLRGHLNLDTQRSLLAEGRALLDGPAGGYVPTVRGGGRMHVRMTCLGRHWNARTYQYEPTRRDHDSQPVAPVPESWARLAVQAAADAGFTIAPDICILNWYDGDGRMGLHQDAGESPASLASGVPVVSFSIGDTARFVFGGHRRTDPGTVCLLESGDAFVFGGPARLRFHGVARILPGTAPGAIACTGRLNLTFREF